MSVVVRSAWKDIRTYVALGQKVQKHANTEYNMAMMLIGSPSFPSDHLALGIEAGSRIFLTTIQVMQIAYEAINDDSCKLRITVPALGSLIDVRTADDD